MHTDKPKLNNISKLILFDIDQTLINNGGAGRKALYRALQKTLQIDTNRPEIANIKMSGKTDPQIVREFILASNLPLNEDDDSHWHKAINQVLDCYLSLLPEEIDAIDKSPKYFIYEGVLEILQLLKNHEEIALGLLTGNVEKGARIKLERFDLNRFFPIGAFGCDSANRLDLPAIAHKRAEEYYRVNFIPAQIVIIGDAENDILCAKNYGATILAVNTGTTTWKELAALEPNYLFSSLKETSLVLEAIMAQPVSRGLFI